MACAHSVAAPSVLARPRWPQALVRSVNPPTLRERATCQDASAPRTALRQLDNRNTGNPMTDACLAPAWIWRHPPPSPLAASTACCIKQPLLRSASRRRRSCGARVLQVAREPRLPRRAGGPAFRAPAGLHIALLRLLLRQLPEIDLCRPRPPPPLPSLMRCTRSGNTGPGVWQRRNSRAEYRK